MRFRKVLVPVAYVEASRRALEFGGRLVKLAHVDLTVLHVHKPLLRGSPLGMGAIREKLAEWGLETGPFKLLRQAEEALIEQGVIKLDEKILPVQKHALRALDKGLYEVHLLGPHEEGIRFRLREGDPVREILHEAEEGYDLIVIGTRGFRGLKRWLVGSIAQEVAFYAPCSILVAKILHPDQGVLVGFHGTEAAREALLQGGMLAEILHTQLKVVAVAEKGGREEAEGWLTEAQSALEEAELEPREVELAPRTGDPEEVLIAEAGQDYLIVLGRSERSKLKKYFFSSLPLRVLDQAPTSVLIAAPLESESNKSNSV